MITLGVSLYAEQETLEEIDNYLSKASAYGFNKEFTSMFPVPGSKEEIIILNEMKAHDIFTFME